MKNLTVYLLSATIAMVLLAASSSLYASSWDAFVYPWVRVYSPAYPSGQDFHQSGNNYGISGNPIEGYHGWPLDRLTFTFDGINLLAPTTTLYTVGGSSGMGIQIVLSGNWAVCGSVLGNQWTPDPYATISNGRVSWASNTPNGYNTNLLIGYDFVGNNAATFSSGSRNYQNPVTGTMFINWFDYTHSFYNNYASIQHSFAMQYTAAPEPSSVITLICGIATLGGLMWKRRSG